MVVQDGHELLGLLRVHPVPCAGDVLEARLGEQLPDVVVVRAGEVLRLPAAHEEGGAGEDLAVEAGEVAWGAKPWFFPTIYASSRQLCSFLLSSFL